MLDISWPPGYPTFEMSPPMRSTGFLKRHPACGRAVALTTAVLIVAACFGIASAAFHASGDSCNVPMHSQGRCDASSSSLGYSLVALPAGFVQVPNLADAGHIPATPDRTVPAYTLHDSLTSRAPPFA